MFPTKEEPSRIFKFTSIWLELGRYDNIIERQTYSLLEWLGDVGGLFDGLRLVSRLIMSPFSSFALKSFLLASIYLPSNNRQNWPKTPKNAQKYRVGFQKHDRANREERYHIFKRCLRHRALLRRVEIKNRNNLDLIKFYRKQRMVILTAMATFSSAQRRRLDRLSVIRESDLEQSL